MKDKAQAGRVNRGRQAEDLVERISSTAIFREHARIYRAHPGVRAGRTVLPQGPDFYGYVVESARFVYVEVKAILSGPLRCPSAAKKSMGHFTATEIERLSTASREGALCVVLVLHGEHLATARWCPVLWRDIETHDTGILRETDILARAMRVGDESRYLDLAESRERIA